MSKIKAILWDMDGTLTPTNSIHDRSYQKVFQDLGINDFVYEKVKGWKTTRVFEARGFKEPQLSELVKKKQDLAFKDAENFTIPIQIVEVLRKLSQKGFRHAIVTGASSRFTQSILKEPIAEGLIELLITSEEPVTSKPDPAPFLRACEKLKIRPEEAVVVEDAEEVLLHLRPKNFAQLFLITENYSESEKNADFISIKHPLEVLDWLSS